MPLEGFFAQRPSLQIRLDQSLLLGVEVFQCALDPNSSALLLGPGIRHDVAHHLTQEREHRGGNRHFAQPGLEGLLQGFLPDVDVVALAIAAVVVGILLASATGRPAGRQGCLTGPTTDHPAQGKVLVVERPALGMGAVLRDGQLGEREGLAVDERLEVARAGDSPLLHHDLSDVEAILEKSLECTGAEGQTVPRHNSPRGNGASHEVLGLAGGDPLEHFSHYRRQLRIEHQAGFALRAGAVSHGRSPDPPPVSDRGLHAIGRALTAQVVVELREDGHEVLGQLTRRTGVEAFHHRLEGDLKRPQSRLDGVVSAHLASEAVDPVDDHGGDLSLLGVGPQVAQHLLKLRAVHRLGGLAFFAEDPVDDEALSLAVSPAFLLLGLEGVVVDLVGGADTDVENGSRHGASWSLDTTVGFILHFDTDIRAMPAKWISRKFNSSSDAAAL